MRRELRLPPQAESARNARAFVDATIADWGLDATAFTASLLTSELVTNAVLHARTDIVVGVDRAGDVVTVSVADGSDKLAERRRHSVSSGTGRGLALVDQLARRWGVEPHDAGKVVWFELGTDEDALGVADVDPGAYFDLAAGSEL